MIEDYDRLLKFRYRFDLKVQRMARLLGVLDWSILRGVEGGLWRLDDRALARLTELESMPEADIKALVSQLPRGPFESSDRKREALAWRWHYGLTHETAAKCLGVTVAEYRMMEANNRVRLPEDIRMRMYQNREQFPPLR